jgi:hypothetical protein
MLPFSASIFIGEEANMPAFALYFVPDADSEFYQAGAQILGYDAWTGEMLPPANSARSHFEAFNVDWPADAQYYGFHMTITHAVDCLAEQLPTIEREIESILNLFDPKKPFTLHPTEDWLRCDGHNVVLYYHPNQALMMFHAMAIARLHPLGYSTPWFANYQRGAYQDVPLVEQHRTRQYWHFGILDDWFPHLALLRQHTGLSVEDVRSRMLQALPAPEPLTVERVCLLVRPDGESHFRVMRVYNRADYPQKIA